MECSKISYKREVYSNKYVPQETHKIPNKQSNLKEQKNKQNSMFEGNNKDQSKINEIETKIKKTIEKINATKSWFYEKNKINL